MKRIVEFRKLMGVERTTSLNEMKKIYRNFMKDCHPDKFQDNETELKAAEEKSKRVIEAYHFLVSISPETAENNKEQYLESINNNIITDFQYKGQVLKIDFSDGNSYEYFGVSQDVYKKLCQSDSQARFARRKICTTFTYRSVSQAVMA
ncbi:MAG: KTSC domain-containing protein [Flavobacteriia bacterium]|nr:KTSC domain-containing protein [Flavobacteriia bacterium]